MTANSAGRTGSAPLPPAQLAKAALRRLAEARQEPTPENYRNAYEAEAGTGDRAAHPGRAVFEQLLQRAAPDLAPAERTALADALCQGQWTSVEQGLKAAHAADGAAWADLIDKTVRATARSSRQWTAARRKDSLQRVLTGSRSDASRLQHRLQQLIASWDTEGSEAEAADPSTAPAADATGAPAVSDPVDTPAASDTADSPRTAEEPVWPAVVASLHDTVQVALPLEDARGRELSEGLRSLSARLDRTPPDAEWSAALADACEQAQRLLAHRHHFTAQLGTLARELTASLADLAEDDSWVQGQCAAMVQHLDDGLTARNVRSVNHLLHGTRQRQQELRQERLAARNALKEAIHRMLHEIGELGAHTGRFEGSIERYAEVIGQADSIESLAGVVQEMVGETRTVHALVQTAQARLEEEHGRALALGERVQALEDELRRISEEVATDPLTQVANRRGLFQAFEREEAQSRRDASSLAIALLDIDNFKKLNDQLGHNTGDAALRFLADRVTSLLRPADTLGRWGGEEFVVLLPGTFADDAQATLTRLQRALSAELFMYEDKQTFITFSAGVTIWREGEPLEAALERADEALYEAKRTGKNRTCVA